MGVKTSLAGITLTAGDLSQTPDDMKGNLLSVSVLKCNELIQLLTRIQAVMTAAGDSANATTIGTQLTALA